MASERGESVPAAIAVLIDNEPFLWSCAIVFFGVGDLVTTTVGLRMKYFVEVGPIVAPLIRDYGIVAMIGLKGFVFVVCYGMWRLVPCPHNVGAPLGLAVLGALLTGWNTTLLALATL